MKFSESWLRSWVNPGIGTDELVAQLTMAGLEVDAVAPVAGSFTGVIVGEILSVEPHPDAEKLKVCRVAGGDEPLQVVCGAANARVGLKVPFATIGAVLPGDFRIKQAKLRGVESFGMLCAQTELEAGEDDSGLWELPTDAPVGEPLVGYLALDDRVIDVDLTPNRGDCLSIAGLAREVGALNRVDVQPVTVGSRAPLTARTFPVRVTAAAQCPRYLGRVVEGVDATARSPLWLTERLRRSGLRSINPIVDVTNYVMLELGQPMHAFDLDRLAEGIDVRLSEEGETLELLGGQSAALQAGTLLITDASGPLAIAGVMGGAKSAVDAGTRNVFLESAYFTPQAMAGTARSYGLHTDSSHRYERGVDFAIQQSALERATQLLIEIAGGEAGPVTEQAGDVAGGGEVTLRKVRLASGLGLQLPSADVEDMLLRLGLECLEEDASHWRFSIPSHRFDIAIEEDLIEEVARIYGYDKLPTQAPNFELYLPRKSETRPAVADVRGHLVSRGYQEVVTYSFVDPDVQRHFAGAWSPVELRNPISSEMRDMRVSLIPGLIGVLKTNLSRQKSRIRCFETGLRFRSPDGGVTNLSQDLTLGCLSYGERNELNWFAKAEDVDFYDLKGDLESLLAQVVAPGALAFRPTADSTYLHPGQAAEVYLDGGLIGVIGALHPVVQKALDIPKPVFVAELELRALLSRTLPGFAGVSRFPEVSRDVAVVVSQSVSFQQVADVVYGAAGNSLTNLKLFDVYRGEHVDPERKSLAFSLTFQHPSRTLMDDEINTSVASVVSSLEKELGATLR